MVLPIIRLHRVLVAWQRPPDYAFGVLPPNVGAFHRDMSRPLGLRRNQAVAARPLDYRCRRPPNAGV